MSGAVLLAVLCGALLHASWNLLVKARRDTYLATAAIYVGTGLFAGLALPFLPTPAPASWPYIAASTGVEIAYGVLLAAAYRVGDLSHAYPLMRGAAPLLVAIGSGTLIGDQLSGPVWLGVGLVSCGIFSLLFDAHSQGRSRAASRLALLNACVIATYTTIDGVGVRLSGQPLAYALWLFTLVAIPWLAWVARAYPWTALRAGMPIGAIGGACALASYTLALWAMTRAPVAAVAAVRETSIVFGTVLSAVILRERVTPIRALAAVAIALGVWTIRAH